MVLKIYLLGQFKLQADDQLLELPSRPAQSLFAYLALNAGLAHRRERLAGLLWPEATENNARAYLRQALWRIRKALDTGSLPCEHYLKVDDISVAFADDAHYWLDASALLHTAPDAPASHLAEALSLYRGELLPGFYDEWIIVERERLQALFQQKMGALLEALLHEEQWDETVHWAEQWIRLGYTPEPAYRALMRAFAALGNKAMVGATYRRCQAALERDLGVEPAAETRQLYARLSQQDSPKSATPPLPLTTEAAQRPLFLDQDRAPRQTQPLFVARTQELARLDTFLERALQDQGQILFVSGEAGSGKTALVDAFVRRAMARHPGLIVAGGNCNAQTGMGDPYLPFREILDRLTGDVEALWAAGAISREHARRLWQLLPLSSAALLQVGPDLLETFVQGSALLSRLSFAPQQEAWPARLAEMVQRKAGGVSFKNPGQSDLFEQYARVLQALARHAPLMLIVDDLQWADLGSVSLLFHLARSLAGVPILLVGAFRPEEVAIGRDGDRHPLAPLLAQLQRQFGDIILDLDRAERRQFLGAILDSEPNKLGEPFRHMLFRQTRGHPLFTLELLRGLQERGDLLRDEAGDWIAGAALDWDKLPARTEAVVAERIDRLAPALRAMLRVASVEGELFTAEVVARIRGVDEQEILDSLSAELDRKHQLIRAHSIARKNGRLVSTYRFRHIQIQKYLYGTLDAVERVHLHEQVGSCLESIYCADEDVSAMAVQFARHFREARIAGKAVHYLFLAGQRAIRLSAYRDALTHLLPALDLLHTLPDGRRRSRHELDLQLAIGTAWMGCGTPSTEMEQAFQRARVLCSELGEAGALSRALSGLAILDYVRARHDTARAFAVEALDLARQARDPLLQMLANWCTGFITFGRGEYNAARDHLLAVLDLYDPLQHHEPLAALQGVDAGPSAMAYDACCLWCLGFPRQALERRAEALQIARRLNHAFTLADVLCYAGCTMDLFLGDRRALVRHAQQLVAHAQQHGLAGWSKMAHCFHGEGLALLGEYDAGIALMQKSIAAKLAADERINLPGRYGILARVYLQLGRLQDAEEMLARAFLSLEESQEWLWEADLHRLQGELYWRQGDECAAQAAFETAIAVAVSQNARSWQLRAATSLAQLWLARGRSAAARKLLLPIYESFEEDLLTPDLARAKALLSELAHNQ